MNVYDAVTADEVPPSPAALATSRIHLLRPASKQAPYRFLPFLPEPLAFTPCHRKCIATDSFGYKGIPGFCGIYGDMAGRKVLKRGSLREIKRKKSTKNGKKRANEAIRQKCV